jgi:hypothetical protein
MKRSLLVAVASFVLMAGAILPALAEKRISVTQLEQTVAELKGAPDADAERRLSDLQLAERLSPQRFAALAQLTVGEKSRQALLAIADQSEFLNLPGSEIPPCPHPHWRKSRKTRLATPPSRTDEPSVPKKRNS